MTPPFNVLVARPAVDDAVEALATAMHEERVDLPGATGGLPEVEAFADAWQRLTGRARRLRFAQGIYRGAAPLVPQGVAGRLRLATAHERPLLVRWWEAFVAEAMPEDAARHDVAEAVERRLGSDGGIAIWEVDREPVSMAGFGSRTPHGVRIGPVYTPPEERRRGYGSALTARLSRRLLDGGRDFCFLYTNLANETSNRIYRAIGYELVCESADLAFEG